MSWDFTPWESPRQSRRGTRAKRIFSTCAILTAALAPLSCFADVIYLKNGRKIVAQVTREDSQRVVYALGEGEVAIARSLIERVEKSATPEELLAAPPPPRARELPLPALPGPEPTADTDSPLLKGAAINEAYLRELKGEFLRRPTPENRNRLKRSYQQAALFLVRSGDPEAAIQTYREALRLLPSDLTLTLALGYLLVAQNHHPEAISLLLPASSQYPQSPDIHVLLGSTFYGQENLHQAIAHWNKALALADDPRVRAAVARAQQEQSVAGSYQELRSQHFLLRYEGSVPEAFSGEVLKTLEAIFFELERDLDYYPTEPIVVLLYPHQAFRDITRSPSWVGAVNDGKVRVPVSGLSVVTAEVARVLKHELAHSFVRGITLGRCPTWFNEGLAQLEEGDNTVRFGSQLARFFSRLPEYAKLEGSFLNLPADQASLAYAKSLAALEYLRETHGMGEIVRLLKAMPARRDFSSLLQDELRLTYPAFEQEVAAYVERRYGSR